MVGAAGLCGVMLLIAGAPLLVSVGPLAQDVTLARLAPFSPRAFETGHPLGTDHLGRDLLSRMLYGGRVSLLVGLAGVLLAGAFGVTVGLTAGYVGGWAETAAMRLVDVQLAIPTMLLAMGMMATLGPSLPNVIVVMGVTSWIVYARTARAVTLVLKQLQYVDAATCCGAAHSRILFRHILPNAWTPIIVIATQQAAQLVLLEASLSFLGIGVPPQIPTWGRMIAEGRNYLTSAWWLSTLPGLALMVTVLALNFFGDGVRDTLDPKLRM